MNRGTRAALAPWTGVAPAQGVVFDALRKQCNLSDCSGGLVRYLSQAKVQVDGLAEFLARSVPHVLVVAMRRSRLVLTPDSPHLPAVRAAGTSSSIVNEALRVHDVLVAAHHERRVELARCKTVLEETTAFELLVLASLHGREAK